MPLSTSPAHVLHTTPASRAGVGAVQQPVIGAVGVADFVVVQSLVFWGTGGTLGVVSSAGEKEQSRSRPAQAAIQLSVLIVTFHSMFGRCLHWRWQASPVDGN